MFQQNNTAIHTARRSKDFFHTNTIRHLDLPPCSPGLNTIENLWGWMARDVWKNGTRFERQAPEEIFRLS